MIDLFLKRNVHKLGGSTVAYDVVSLFSGCGGLDLGFERVEGLSKDNKDGTFEVIFASDIDEEAVKTYAKNFDIEDNSIYHSAEDLHKNSTKYEGAVEKRLYQGDIRKVDFTKALKRSGNNEEIDIVLGGFPCQDFSMLRGKDKRKGIKVKRGRLYLEFVRALVQLQPKIFVAENVKGIKSANEGAAFNQIKEDFQNLNENWGEIEEKLEKNFPTPNNFSNYKILFSDVVNFSEYGVPQNRERLIMIGIREDLIKDMKIKSNLEKQLKPKKDDYFPVTPIEVFEGKLLPDLNMDYIKTMVKFEGFINEIDTEKSNDYLKNDWSKYAFNNDNKSDYSEIINDYKRLNDINFSDFSEEVEKHHKNVLKKLGVWNRPVSQLTIDECRDGSNKKANCQKHVQKRLRRIPPGENHEFVRGTDHSVKGLMSNIYRRVHPLVPSPTIIANGGGGTWGYHYEIERQKLTNRERARLQTFPDDFEFAGNKSDVRRQIGNAVPPLAGTKIAESVKKILDKIDAVENSFESNSTEEKTAAEYNTISECPA